MVVIKVSCEFVVYELARLLFTACIVESIQCTCDLHGTNNKHLHVYSHR